jgi:hypothetical protein
VGDLAADPGAALFAGLSALPKTTALTTYSYRLQHAKQKAFLTALDKATIRHGLATGDVLNLDFHAVMHWGADADHPFGGGVAYDFDDAAGIAPVRRSRGPLGSGCRGRSG